jgi:hypothetical protein
MDQIDDGSRYRSTEPFVEIPADARSRQRRQGNSLARAAKLQFLHDRVQRMRRGKRFG